MSAEPQPAPPAPSPPPALAGGGAGRVARLALLALVLGLAVKGLLSLVPREERAPTVEAVQPPTVAVLELQREPLPRSEERHARLQPVQEWTLALEVGGRLAERPVANGQAVPAGRLLVALDPEPFLAERAAAEASQGEAEAALGLARTELARLQQLGQSTATKRAIDQARAERDRALAQLAGAQARLRQAVYRLEHSRIEAPAGGVVSHLSAEVGQVVAPGQVLGRLTRQDRLLVKLLVSAEVRRGVAPATSALVVDGREREHAARLVRAAPVQAGATGQFELEFELDDAAGQLLAGEPVRIRFSHGAQRPRLRVPRCAVYEEYGLWRALVPGSSPEEPRAGSVPVVLGESDPQAGWVEVLRGLSAGDRLLVPERVAQVREGQRVRLGEVETPWLPPYAR